MSLSCQILRQDRQYSASSKKNKVRKKALTSDTAKSSGPNVKRLINYSNAVLGQLRQIDAELSPIDTKPNSKGKEAKSATGNLVGIVKNVISALTKLEKAEIYASLKSEQDLLAEAETATSFSQIHSKHGALGLINFVTGTLTTPFKTPFSDAAYTCSGTNVFVQFRGPKDDLKISYGDGSNYLDTVFQAFLKKGSKDLYINATINPIITYLEENQKIKLGGKDSTDHEIIKAISSGTDEEKANAISAILKKIIVYNNLYWKNFAEKVNELKIRLADKVNNDQVINHAYTTLSGMLLLAESRKNRNPTFGRIERGAMKNVLKHPIQIVCFKT